MTRFASLLLVGAALALGTVSAPAAAAPSSTAQARAEGIVFGEAHIEAALSGALRGSIARGRLKLELDAPQLEIRAAGQAGSLAVERLYHNPVNDRFAAELVVIGAQPAVRVPVSGRAWGVLDIPVLTRRLAMGDTITGDDVALVELRAEVADREIATAPEDLVGLTVRRTVPVNQPVRLRDVQSARLVDKGALVTIVLATARMTLTAQGRAQQDGGKGDVIRVINTQTNRTVEATIVGINQVAVAKPGVPAF